MEVDYRCYQYNIAVPPFDRNYFLSIKLIPYWKIFWQDLLLELNSEEGLKEDELQWQDRITYITRDNQIVAMQFVACYQMSEFANSDYAKRYLPQDLSSTYNKELGFINTLQYLSVDPGHGYRKTGINFASILMDMSHFHQHELQAKKTITVTRNSVGIHNLSRKVGFKERGISTKHNVDVSIMQTENPQRHPRKSITKMSDYLWENRVLVNKEECAA